MPRTSAVALALAALPAVTPQCQDTEGWTNRFGADCDAYLHDGHCNGYRFVAGHEWTAGDGYDNPELHCCICGKGLPPEQFKQSCTDTPGWHNQYDSDCATYVTDKRCAAKAMRPGNEWAGGAEWNWPEHNCCACGKKPEVAPPPAPPPCADTPGWTNPWGSTCATYVADGHCVDGTVAEEHEWTQGKEFGNPERNCCACGKLPWPPTTPPPSPPSPPPPSPPLPTSPPPP